ncbi:hypothetical protein I312_100071 [Cryptococcus bacillisporus CA1280]|uniref:uncharacterized protein n=1 Tax=Cryptococcus bacillisporus CA1280 TaxID=1296109 RepID=UPI00336762A7
MSSPGFLSLGVFRSCFPGSSLTTESNPSDVLLLSTSTIRRRRNTTRKADDSSWRAGESIDRATVRDYLSQNSLASSKDHRTTPSLSSPANITGYFSSNTALLRIFICLADSNCCNSTPLPIAQHLSFKPN